MSSIVLTGDTSGAITVSAPAVAGTNTITMPASSGTLAIGDSTGSVIEELHSLCNGTDLRGRATITNVTGVQNLTTTYAVATGSEVTNYTPPVGTTMVIYEYNFYIGYANTIGGISHYRFYYSTDGSTYIEAESLRRNHFAYYGGSNPIFRVPIILGASTGVANDAILTDVRPTLYLKWETREYGSGNQQKLHATRYWDGADVSIFSKPQVMIKAIV